MDFKEKLIQFKYKISIPIRFSDMDMFGHANNAVYLTYFEQARSNYWKDIIQWDWKTTGIIFAKAEVDYLKPILLDDEIYAYVRTTRLGKSSFDIEYLLVAENDKTQVLKTIGKTTQVAIDYQINKSVPIPEKQRYNMVTYDNPEI